MFYSDQPEQMRAFLRDKLGFPATDVGDGWLIFAMPDADMGVHPTDSGHGPPSGTRDISFYCDDIEQTVAELQAKGVEFTQPIHDAGFGLVTLFKAPGNIEIQLYQPHYERRC